MAAMDLRQVADAFHERVPDLVDSLTKQMREVPSGSVATYGQLAQALGDTAASRWVATWLLEADCPLAEISHRVVRSTGEIGLHFSGDVSEKKRRLQNEGVVVSGGKVELGRFQVELPAIQAPLAALKAWQNEFVCPQAAPLDLNAVQTIGGLDVSYTGHQAVAVCSRFEADGTSPLGHASRCQEVRFPYVTGYLAFRELPLHLELLAQMQTEGTLPDLLLVDGNGRLHPRRMGIATMLGGLTGIPTIGIAKKKICGVMLADQLSPGVWEPIVEAKDQANDILGYTILPHAKTKHPLYVSIGHGIDSDEMQEVVSRSFAGHRSPEPIYAADRESRRIASTLATA
ncbi:hypothetical protein GC197_14890 [bacterium]|nr:hypothetical protein [bacterium]